MSHNVMYVHDVRDEFYPSSFNLSLESNIRFMILVNICLLKKKRYYRVIIGG